MNDAFQNELQSKVLARLHKSGVCPRSRAYFVVRALFVACLSVFVLMLSAYTLSFIVFTLYASGQQFLLGFGLRGVRAFLMLFPWVAVALDIACIGLLSWLLQSFKFGYRISIVSLIATVVIMSGLIASAIDMTPIHGWLLDRADRGDLPIIGEIYNDIRASHSDQGVFRGTIQSMQNNTVTIAHNDQDHDDDDGTRIVTLPQNFDKQLHIGDRIFVFGDAGQGATIQAYGVEILSDDQ